VYVVQTADGWKLVAHRHRPTGPPKPGAAPVILCHGLSYNASFWSLDPACNFIAYLTAAGYDVWAVDLRGSGASQKWVWNLEEAPDTLVNGALRRLSQGKLGQTRFTTIDPKYANWSLDQHIAYDVPALVRLVRHHTGAPEVTWIGHSMGGIVALAHLARYQNPGIGRLVAIGSQVTMPNGQVPLQFFKELIAVRERQLAGQLRGQELLLQTRTSVHNLFFNVPNTPPRVYAALGSWAADIPAVGVLGQYTVLATRGELLDGPRRFRYAQHLGNIQIPVFFGGGQLDQFAPPPVQQYLFDHVGSTDKKLVIFGRAQGFSVDCGHDDVLVGLNSRTEVYPVIERWISGVRP
ncbi:MAG: alpha/beta fold hydrolase, partial [Isosphaeraceae bacterium]|nr:alpha/beta fold hydrolase [Isosphaeraceae bacterium]